MAVIDDSFLVIFFFALASIFVIVISVFIFEIRINAKLQGFQNIIQDAKTLQQTLPATVKRITADIESKVAQLSSSVGGGDLTSLITGLAPYLLQMVAQPPTQAVQQTAENTP